MALMRTGTEFSSVNHYKHKVPDKTPIDIMKTLLPNGDFLSTSAQEW